MVSKSERLAALKKKQAQLDAQVQALEAAEKTRDRKRETRRKILLGAYYLEQARKDGTFDEVVSKMDGYLKRKSDRALFGLPEKEKAVTGQKKP